VKARPPNETLPEDVPQGTFTPVLIFVIALPEEKDNCDPGVVPLDRLPRWCPVCRDTTIVGHGRRLRNAHDDRHERVWIRRGICQRCDATFTILPDWLVPLSHYGLRCRQQACERIAAGESAEQATPHCKDPARLTDSSTVRRWAWRRVLSVWCWAKTAAAAEYSLNLPTLLAWDLSVFCRILPLEAEGP
jgi:Domain of unknown function (DUF6431)